MRPVHSDYLVYPLRPKTYKRIVDGIIWLIKKAKQKGWITDFDSIAFSGNSGAIIAPAVAAELNVGMILGRKPTERNHSSYSVEGAADVKRFIIVDDMVNSGETVERIQDKVREWTPKRREKTNAKCVGIFCYADCDDKYVNDCKTIHFFKGVFITGLREKTLKSRKLLTG